jgi:predicted alpha/beta-hydrolase family hydrolase
MRASFLPEIYLSIYLSLKPSERPKEVTGPTAESLRALWPRSMAGTSVLPSRVHFCHGLESGPRGFKFRKLSESFSTVSSPDMQMSLWNPLQCNSVARNLLRLRPPAEALADSFEACVEVQRQALQALQASAASPDVLVGSSWGGAVAAALLGTGVWSGPCVLMCPALHLRERRAGEASSRPHLTSVAISAGLAALPAAAKAQCLIVHGTADATVPVEDSRALAAATGIPLLEVEGGNHGLGDYTASGGLRASIVSLLATRT